MCVDTGTIMNIWSQRTCFVPVVPTGARMPVRYLNKPGLNLHLPPRFVGCFLMLLVWPTGRLWRPSGVRVRQQALPVWSNQLGRWLRKGVSTRCLHQSDQLQQMDRREDGSDIRHSWSHVSSQMTRVLLFSSFLSGLKESDWSFSSMTTNCGNTQAAALHFKHTYVSC